MWSKPNLLPVMKCREPHNPPQPGRLYGNLAGRWRKTLCIVVGRPSGSVSPRRTYSTALETELISFSAQRWITARSLQMLRTRQDMSVRVCLRACVCVCVCVCVFSFSLIITPGSCTRMHLCSLLSPPHLFPAAVCVHTVRPEQACKRITVIERRKKKWRRRRNY